MELKGVYVIFLKISMAENLQNGQCWDTFPCRQPEAYSALSFPVHSSQVAIRLCRHNYGFERTGYDWDFRHIDTSFRINVRRKCTHITPESVYRGLVGGGVRLRHSN